MAHTKAPSAIAGLSCCLSRVQVKAAELASVQRLEAAELRKQEEKARRLEQARARASAETHVREKVAAATFARGYIKGISQLPSRHMQPYLYAAGVHQ